MTTAAATIAADEWKGDKQRGSKLDVIGSTGEKARILLAIETDFPGSIGTLTISYNNNDYDDDGNNDSKNDNNQPQPQKNHLRPTSTILPSQWYTMK